MDGFDLVTDSECDGAHPCDLCSLYGNCRDRRPISPCRLCGRKLTDEELYGGVCKECLVDAVDPYTVREYVNDSTEHCNRIWESLLETYFSDPDDKCHIDRVSATLKDRLMRQIILEWDNDKIFEQYGQFEYHAKDRLVAWVGEDDVAWEDFAAWLIKKREAKK